MNIETANRLAELRKKNGLSQEELADKLGLSRQAVSKWERAESSPDTDNLILLAKIYGVSLDDLLKSDKPVDEIIKDNKEKTETENQKKKEEEKMKDHVSISGDGIHVTSKNGDSVHIGVNGIHINDKDYNSKVKIKRKKRKKIVDMLYGVSFALATILYILFSVFWDQMAFTKGGNPSGWAVGWILYIVALIIPSIVDAIWIRIFYKVNYIFIGLSAFLYLGMMYGAWHPWWCLILAAIVLHIVTSSVEKVIYGDRFEDKGIEIGDMLPPLIEVGASRSRILPNPVSTS